MENQLHRLQVLLGTIEDTHDKESQPKGLPFSHLFRPPQKTEFGLFFVLNIRWQKKKMAVLRYEVMGSGI